MVFAPVLAQQLRQKTAGPAHARHGDGGERFGTADLPPQRGVWNPEHQHAVCAAEYQFVAPSAVAEREVADMQHRLAPVLAVGALALELQVQEEHPVSGARHMGTRMTNDLSVGIHLRERHIADRAAHDGTVENPDVFRFRDERREAFAGPIIPECELAPRIQADRREGLNLRHVISPVSLPGTIVVVDARLYFLWS